MVGRSRLHARVPRARNFLGISFRASRESRQLSLGLAYTRRRSSGMQISRFLSNEISGVEEKAEAEHHLRLQENPLTASSGHLFPLLSISRCVKDACCPPRPFSSITMPRAKPSPLLAIHDAIFARVRCSGELSQTGRPEEFRGAYSVEEGVKRKENFLLIRAGLHICTLGR